MINALIDTVTEVTSRELARSPAVSALVRTTLHFHSPLMSVTSRIVNGFS
jgi:hypothetical protein